MNTQPPSQPTPGKDPALWHDPLLLAGLGLLVVAGIMLGGILQAGSGMGLWTIGPGLLITGAAGLLAYRYHRLAMGLLDQERRAHAETRAENEALLKARKEDYRRHLDRSPQAIAVHGEAGIVYVNEASLKLMGATSTKQLLGRSVLEFVHPDYVEMVAARIGRMRREWREMGALEEKLIRLDGAVIDVEVSAMPVTYQDHPAIQITLHDVTERRQMERALRASEQKFSQIFKSAPVGISITTLAEGRFLDVNQSMLDLLEFDDRQELIGRTSAELGLLAPDWDRAEMIRTLLEDPSKMYGQEFQTYTKRGQPKEVIGSVDLIEVNGQPCILGIMLDVSEHKEAEARIASLKRFYENILDEIPLQVAVLDREARFVYNNPASIRDKNVRTQIPGKTSIDLAALLGHSPEPFEARHAWLLNAAARKETSRIEECLVDSHGEQRWFERVVCPVFDSHGEVLYLIGYGVDITDQKADARRLRAAKEQAEELAQLKSAFLSNMSHEIRTPLTGIIGFASMLADELEDERCEMAELIRQSGERLLETLNSVLDLARIEARTMEVIYVRTELRAEIRETVNLFVPSAINRNIALEMRLPTEPVQADIDTSFFQRVLSNLISNALKFTEHGKIVVELKVRGDEALLSVRDTGIGISEAFLPHLFDEFRQESIGLARSHTGSGLGLAITKRLVEYLNGQIEVESVKGKGTCFTIRLPLAVQEAEPV